MRFDHFTIWASALLQVIFSSKYYRIVDVLCYHLYISSALTMSTATIFIQILANTLLMTAMGILKKRAKLFRFVRVSVLTSAYDDHPLLSRRAQVINRFRVRWQWDPSKQ